jgi:hypothetical protein
MLCRKSVVHGASEKETYYAVCGLCSPFHFDPHIYSRGRLSRPQSSDLNGSHEASNGMEPISITKIHANPAYEASIL